MDKEQMALPPQPWEFRSKPAYQRLIIMLGGVTVNFILAFIIYIGMAFAYGETYVANSDFQDGMLINNPVMQEAGFKTGDKIIAADGEKIARFDNDITMKLIMSRKVLIERDGKEQEIALPVDLVDRLSQYEKTNLIDIRMPFVIGAVEDDSPNTTLQPKDLITSLNGQPTKYFDQAEIILANSKGKTIPATILRDQKEQNITLKISKEGTVGVQRGGLTIDNLEKLGYYKISKQEYSFMESIPVGLTKGKDQLIGYGKQLKMIFNPQTKAYKQVGGFKAIFDIFPETWSWETFWRITALLSIMLGVMNLLPIPALDGGHVMFLLYEIISGKKPSDKFLENAQVVGFVLLITLLLFANGNDIYKAIVGR
jgi:regulator of sigma E protease